MPNHEQDQPSVEELLQQFQDRRKEKESQQTIPVSLGFTGTAPLGGG